MKYRREIDGLRAVAILPVIFFHAGFKAFEGGFIGVDVFFVVSGYLITTIILSDMNNQKFSIVTFYERRARRILPALFFVMLCCLPFAWMWLLPSHLKDFSESLAAVSAFSSNILFWRESGYFGVASELKPLLHTWSLAVEEQYYVLFPLFLMLLWKLRKRWIFGSLMLVGAISLLAAQWGAYHYPSATFFLLPTRGWELAIGALIAFYFLYKREHKVFIRSHKKTSEIFGFIGLFLICYSIFAFDKNTPFPSLYALLPTLGTGLIIVFSTSETAVGRFLGIKPMVGIGLISYSTYLWHQPLFVFARHRSLTEPGTSLLLALSAASILLAYISWRYVESPFRNKKAVSRKGIFIFAVVGSLVFALIGITGHLNDGFRDRVNFTQKLTKSFERSSSRGCFDKGNIHFTDDWYCTLGENKKDISFVVFGDSHALSLLDAFDSASINRKLSGAFVGISGCTPFLGVYALRNDQNEKNCNLLNERVFNFIEENNIQTLILVARWSYYTDGGYSGNDFSYIGLKESDIKSKEKSREAFKYGLQKTLQEYNKKGVKVVILSDVPQQNYDPQNIYERVESSPGNEKNGILNKYSVKIEDYKKLNKFANNLFESNSSKLYFYKIDNILCDNNVCPIGTENVSYYFDDDHLSIIGARRLIPVIENIFHETVPHK